MANEIAASIALSASKGGVSVNNTANRNANMAGSQMISNVQIIGTVAEALVFGDVTTPGYVFLKNLDVTNFVEIALDAAVATQRFAKLLAGDFALFPTSTATLYAKADTASVNLLVEVVAL